MEERQERRRDFGTMVAKITEIGFVSYDHVLFANLTLNIRRTEVTAITGKSGSGKTVLLKILTGQENQQDGTIFIHPNTKISFVPQELDDIEINKETDIRHLFKDARGLTELETKLSRYEELISKNPDEKTLSEFGDVLDQYQKMEGYNPEPEMERILVGLGVNKESTRHITLDTKLSEVSSGQLRKILIARALYSDPDLLILDDPTSHLDVAAVDWLADYLKNAKSAVVMASNNRAFIDKCANQTIGLTDIGRVFVFSGGYSNFIEKRDAVLDAEKSAAESVMDKIEQLRDTDKMFRDKQVYNRSSTMGKVGRSLSTRMDRLSERLKEMPGSKEVYKNERVANLVFEEEKRSGQDILSIQKVLKKYGDFVAVDLRNVDAIDVKRGEKWLIWGENGSGKSTLVKMIAHLSSGGSFLPNDGKIKLGANIQLGYFTPDDVEIHAKGTLLEETVKAVDSQNKGRVAATLRFFGFTTTAIYRQSISTLSSGERKRLRLATIMLEKPNLIILDEPTGDYLQEDVKARFASAINGYTGTLILVSHEKEFIDQIKINHELQMPSGNVILKD